MSWILWVSFLFSGIAYAAVSEEDFAQSVSQFEKTMGPWLRRTRRATLLVDHRWNSEELRGGGAGASGTSDWKTITVWISGALARTSVTTTRTVLFALCHELGHLAAKEDQYSDEAHADAFAMSLCLPLIWNTRDRTVLAKACQDATLYRYHYTGSSNSPCTEGADHE